MIEEKEFEIFLFVSKRNFKIFVLDIEKSQNLYCEELTNSQDFNFQNLSILSKFLDENIFKIEKLVGYFIKDIILIIENDNNLNVNISIKKKNFINNINKKFLENSLAEIKDLFKENYQDQTIMHVILINYIVDGQKFFLFEDNLNSDNLCLEVQFISISNELTFIFDRLLEKYQIKISKYMCGDYIKSFFDQSDNELSVMANKLKNGFNDNEAVIIPKNTENKGFFEKFFQLFS